MKNVIKSSNITILQTSHSWRLRYFFTLHKADETTLWLQSDAFIPYPQGDCCMCIHHSVFFSDELVALCII